MLRANVGLSRKISENYNSTGFTLNLEGEILATLDDPEAVIERVKRTLRPGRGGPGPAGSEAQEIDSAIASRDAEPQPGRTTAESNRRPAPETRRPPRPATAIGTRSPPNGEPATNKQVQFLQTLAKRQKLFGPKLEAFIEEVIGRRCSPYDLSKKEAGAVIDALNPEAAGDNRPRR